MTTQRNLRTKRDPLAENVQVLVFEEECAIAPASHDAPEVSDQHNIFFKNRNSKQTSPDPFSKDPAIKDKHAKRQTQTNFDSKNDGRNIRVVFDSNRITLAHEFLEI